MKKAIRIVLIGLAAALALGAAALAVDTAGPAGTEEDPLVTLSYLNEVFTERVTELFRKDLEEKETELQAALEERVGALEALAPGEGGGSAEYTVETLYDGQTLICQRGAELLLRVGEAEVLAADTPGLVDTTTAENLNDGQALVKNHLYMATINGHGIRAVGTVKIVVRGAYDIS